jgi:hypothetical protein
MRLFGLGFFIDRLYMVPRFEAKTISTSTLFANLFEFFYDSPLYPSAGKKNAEYSKNNVVIKNAATVQSSKF